MSAVEELKNMSKYAGERFDLVQAGGGNSSVKLDNGEMLIKASGVSLSDVTANSGFSRVLTNEVSAIVKEKQITDEQDKRKREHLTAEQVRNATLDHANRPSIETLLHSFLLKYTLHTHPIVVNAVVVRENWKTILQSIFVDDEVAYVDYETPGIDLAIKLDAELTRFKTIPKIIFLQNHGLIITSEELSEIREKTEYVVQKIEDYLKMDLSAYKSTNAITALLKSVWANDNITYLCEDGMIHQQLIDNKEVYAKTPFCPDSFVYCGMHAVEIKAISDKNSIEQYLDRYHELPKIIIYKNKLYIAAQNVRKAKEIEEVLKFNVMVAMQQDDHVNHLEWDELAYLANWEAEKFRQKR